MVVDGLVSAKISLRRFSHSKVTHDNKEPEFHDSSRVVALYRDGQLLPVSETQAIPRLVRPLSKMAYRPRPSARLKSKYLGSDLFKAPDHGPMNSTLLESVTPCLSYMFGKEDKLNNSPTANKIRIVAARHNLTKLVSSYFDHEPVELYLVYVPASSTLIFNSRTNDLTNDKKNVKSWMSKIISSGFAFEDLVTTMDFAPSKLERKSEQKLISNRVSMNSDNPESLENSKIPANHLYNYDSKGPVFAIVEHDLPSLQVLVRCELDSYNDLQNMFTELKCFSPLKRGNDYHRLKLLKAWIQTGFLPQSDVLIGERDTSSGTLLDIYHYKRSELRQVFDSIDLPPRKKYTNFDANVACSWYRYCLQSIVNLVQVKVVDAYEHKFFRLTLSPSRDMELKPLRNKPSFIKIDPRFIPLSSARRKAE